MARPCERTSVLQGDDEALIIYCGSLALLLAAAACHARSLSKARWLCVMGSATTMSLGWVLAIAT